MLWLSFLLSRVSLDMTSFQRKWLRISFNIYEGYCLQRVYMFASTWNYIIRSSFIREYTYYVLFTYILKYCIETTVTYMFFTIYWRQLASNAWGKEALQSLFIFIGSCFFPFFKFGNWKKLNIDPVRVQVTMFIIYFLNLKCGFKRVHSGKKKH